MKGAGRRFVVDADVARAAADPSQADRRRPLAPGAAHAGKSLKALRDARHTLVFCPALHAEWRRHAAAPRFAHRWLAQMLERRLIVQLNDDPDDAPLQAVVAATLPPGDRDVAQKDLHIVNLALHHADHRLLSLDKRAREKFSRLVEAQPALADLHWAVPDTEAVVGWLLARAPESAAHKLSAHRPG